MSQTMNTTSTNRINVAKSVRDRVLRSRERFWRAEDFGFDSDSHNAVLLELSRLAREEGELRHIRRDLYWRGEKTMLGMAPPATTQLVKQLVGEVGVGPASWTAALALGLTTQHPARDYIAVPKRPLASLPRSIELKDRSAREGRTKERLNWWEVALLEVLGAPQVIEVDDQTAVSQLVDWLSSPNVRTSKLARAARNETALARENLRGLLSVAGLSDEASTIPPARSLSVRDRALVAA